MKSISGQELWYQDIYRGGICFSGFSTGLVYGNGTFDTYIEPGSVVQKVFLIYNIHGEPSHNLQISIDGINYSLTNESYNNQAFLETQFTNEYKFKINVLDISSSFLTQNSHTFSIPNQTFLNCGLNCFYANCGVLILYENANLSICNVSLVLNNQDLNAFNTDYSAYVNPIISSLPVGFSINSDIVNLPSTGDGSNVYFEGNLIGLIGGADNVNPFSTFGTRGHFYYQNSTLFNLDDDTNDAFMSNSDALADISSYINSNTYLNWRLAWQNNSVHQNNYSSFTIAYTPSCDTFSVEVTEDTSICQGTSLQLNCSGGQMYEWTPTNNLSCSDCPNPIFTGDSSSFYTVRIWNNDSCSVIRPLKINVLKNPIIESITSQSSECGYNSGSIDLTANIAAIMPITFLLNDTLSNAIGSFQNLSAGVYSLNIIDGNGCWSGDTIITVGEQNSTSAFFTTNTNYGASPLNIIIDNSSENATNFVWEINNLDFGNSLNSVTFDTSGIYTLQLVAWQFDPACADTFSMVINVVDSLIIPTLFTPNSDGKNDVWTISSIDQLYPDNQIIIFNRWGSVVFESKKGEYFGNEWNGTYQGNELPFGTYFYIINTGIIDKVYTGYVSLIR